ncbi:MAG TPA: hypothetical protein VH933_16350, partial [Aestuariivirgaceae bacterium]
MRKRDDRGFLEVAHYLGTAPEQHQEFGDRLWSILNHYDDEVLRVSARPPSPAEILQEFLEVESSVEITKQKIQSLSEAAKNYIIHQGQRYSITSVDEEGNPSLSSPLAKFELVVSAISDIQSILAICIETVRPTVGPGQPSKEDQRFLVESLIDLYLQFGGSVPSSADIFKSDD